MLDFDREAFLETCWQRKPCLIRNPWPAWRNPLEPEELAGLACEDDVEARLVTRRAGSWIAEHGPFAERRFDTPDTWPWTLLVQAVDHLVPDVAALIEPFRFVPNWRIDDVMVSYATDGGGVGPHYDQYDVFLIQGLGQRRWRVGGRCDETTPLLPHDDLRLLAGFETADEWVLGPGDILYIPPGIAHEGTAVGDDCMTYSVGFRAPSRSEMIAHWCDHVLEDLGEDDRYEDRLGAPGTFTQANPGEIAPGALAGLHAMVTERMLDRAGFARWFGQYNSQRKYPEIDWRPLEPLTSEIALSRIGSGVAFRRNPASRFAFVRTGAEALTLFVDGAAMDCVGSTCALAEQICAQSEIVIDHAAPGLAEIAQLVAQLANQGSAAFDDDGDGDGD